MLLGSAPAATATAISTTLAMAGPSAFAARLPTTITLAAEPQLSTISETHFQAHPALSDVTAFALAAGPQLSTISDGPVQAGPAFSDAGYVVLLGLALAFGARAAFDSLFIENSEFKPPDLSSGIPTFGLAWIPGLVAKPVEDPVAQAEILRLKLQRALAKKDQFAVQMIEKDLQELIEREGLAFGTTPEEDEAAEAAAAAERAEQQ